MEAMKISKSSWLYKIAKLGGFKDYTVDWSYAYEEDGYRKIPSSSCSFIRSVLIGGINALVLSFVVLGMIQNFILVLIALGLPQESINLINTTGSLVSYLFGAGLLGWVVFMIAALVYVIHLCITYVWPHIYRFIRKVLRIVSTVTTTPTSVIRKHIDDYADGICKPVELTD